MKVDEKAPLKAPERFRFIGQRLPRPDVPAKVTGHHRYLHDLVLPGMLHARVIRPPALGATLVSVDESSIAGIGGARVVRIQSFLAVVAEREWDAVRAAPALQAERTAGTRLPDSAKEFATQEYYNLLALVPAKSVWLEEYAREQIQLEEQHIAEVEKMIRKPGELNRAG